MDKLIDIESLDCDDGDSHEKGPVEDRILFEKIAEEKNCRLVSPSECDEVLHRINPNRLKGRPENFLPSSGILDGEPCYILPNENLDQWLEEELYKSVLKQIDLEIKGWEELGLLRLEEFTKFKRDLFENYSKKLCVSKDSFGRLKLLLESGMVFYVSSFLDKWDMKAIENTLNRAEEIPFIREDLD